MQHGEKPQTGTIVQSYEIGCNNDRMLSYFILSMSRFVHLALVAALVFVPLAGWAQSFVLSTDGAGFSSVSNTNGVAVADYDLDGDLDVYFVNSLQHDEADPDSWSRLFRNDGDGLFTDVTETAGVRADFDRRVQRRNPQHQEHGPPSMGHRFGASWGDYDNDGDPDLFLTAAGRDILYRNDGDGNIRPM